MRMAIIAAFVCGLGACNLVMELEDHPCPDGGTTLTYENFGRKFINDNCQSCHASDSDNRRGAPFRFSFDTLDDVRLHIARIFARGAADNSSMPPGPIDPPKQARWQLAEWLACGAPE